MTSPAVICIGGATLDRKYRGLQPLAAGTSNPVNSGLSFGGVARNVCETLARLGVHAGLASHVGKDAGGAELLRHLEALGVSTTLTCRHDVFGTAEYVAALQPDGGLAFGLADMAILDAFTPEDMERLEPVLAKAQWVFADCNLPAAALKAVIDMRQRGAFRLAVDPVSMAKAARLPNDLSGIDLLVLNRDEAAAILGQSLAPAETITALRQLGASRLILTSGAAGLHVADGESVQAIPARMVATQDVTGAGDALIGAVIAALLNGSGLVDAARIGMEIAALTVQSPRTVRDDLSPALLERLLGSRHDT